MSEFQTRRLDSFIADGSVLLGRGDIISKEDIEAHPGPYPIYSSSAQGNGKFGEYGKFMFDEELITWSVDGGGYFFYRDKHRYSVTNVCGYMRVKSSKLQPKFVFYSLANQHRYQTFDYTTKAHPSVIQKLYWLPTIGYEQQEKIATILTGIDTAIEKTEALIAKYQQIKAGLMYDLFTRGVLPNSQLRPPREQAPELYQETAIGWIPKQWAVRNLGSMARIVSGVTLGSKESGSGGLEVPYLRVANVQDGYLDLTEIKTVRVTRKELEQLRLQVGDVLMNEGGDFDKLGRGAVWSGEIEDCVHQNHVFRVRTDSSSLLPYFLAFYSESSFGKKYFLISSKQSTNLASINSTQLNAYPIALPSREEQQAIIKRISAVNGRIEQMKTEAGKLRNQKSGLMHDLLTGKVPVKVEEAEVVDG
jgi:type I restriction enzyme S subunit